LPASGFSSNAFFFFGHPPCDFNALVLFFDFVVTHNNHPIFQESLTAKNPLFGSVLRSSGTQIQVTM
jgi:hypothetical protein